MEETKKRKRSVRDRTFLALIIICTAMILVYQVQSVYTLLSPTPTPQPNSLTLPADFEIGAEER